MSTADEEKTPYELLHVGLEATEQEIKKAYRKLSLKVHPDKNPDNPQAAQLFFELNQAYEILLDPLRRQAITASVKVKEARKARFSKYDQKRKDLQTELEERERAFKRQKTNKAAEAKARTAENERIMEEGRRMRERKDEEMNRKAAEEARVGQNGDVEDDVPQLGHLDTTVKLRISLSLQPSLTTPAAVSSLLARFGEIDESSIVLSMKPPKKAPTKPPKNATALVPFKQIGDAFAAVCASGRSDRGLDGVEVSWAEGKEPPILGWLKKQGKLELPKARNDNLSESVPENAENRSKDLFESLHKKTVDSTFSSFPDAFSSAPDFQFSPPPAKPAETSAPGLDYESLTLMRLRQAERAKLEQEIRDQEAEEA